MAIEFNRANSTQNLTKNNAPPTKAGSNDNSTSQATQADASTPTKSLGESVKISQNALELQSINDKLKQMPDINHDKVQELKQAINDGSYKVDSVLTANKMLDFEAQL
ncbi:MAG: flagellar biosynthesis anti-sigma factor FlgM [Thiopseudomonas sp.]|nr:flagellar biosynthesis anti-sigma factor FlgM [Thiopseudomonas sp.]MCK9464656.1 flagellar biosynthesis anti-sigma factor FlgM [Thiopseudomonas sp.]